MTKKGKQLKSLKNRILQPNLIIAVVIMAVIFIAFNFSLRVVLTSRTVKDVNKSREMLTDLLRIELKDDDPVEFNADNQTELRAGSRELINALNLSLRFTQRSFETELFLINEQGKILFPRTTISDTSDNLIKEALLRLEGENSVNDGTYRIRVGGKGYIVSLDKANISRIMRRTNYLVIIAPLSDNEDLIRSLSLLLLGIMLLAFVLWGLFIRRLTDSIIKPLKSVSDYAREIAKGKYEEIKPVPDSLEVEKLYYDLNQMRIALQRKDQEKTDFLQNFSHDLRTPLMSIQGYAEGIITGVFDEVTKPASIIAQESMRLKKLVEQLLTLSRIESFEENSGSTEAPLKINEELAKIVERFQGLAASLDKKIITQNEKEIFYSVNLDLLEKVVSNILSNALKYAERNIIISLYEKENGFEISIQDDGPGIPKEMRDRIFARFEKGKDGNYGLGLSIAKSAARKIGGELLLGSPTKGAQFIFSFQEKKK